MPELASAPGAQTCPAAIDAGYLRNVMESE